MDGMPMECMGAAHDLTLKVTIETLLIQRNALNLEWVKIHLIF
jgi:hypothetical protein